MKNIGLILSVIIAFIYHVSYSQEITHDNFYMQNPFAINPAATGIDGNVSANLNYRDQWYRLKGAPETFKFGIHGMGSKSTGLGLNVEQTNSGIFSHFAADLNYSYRIRLGKSNESLAFGLRFGFAQNKLNYDKIIINNIDPALNSSNLINEALVRTGLGIHYNRDFLNLHLSIPLAYGMHEKSYLQIFYALVSYDLYLNDKSWRIKPSLFYRNLYGNINQLDVNLVTEWNNIWALVGYRTNKNVITGFGLNIKNIGIAYSYEINRSDLYTITPGSHEIVLTFNPPFSLTSKEPIFKSLKRRNNWSF